MKITPFLLSGSLILAASCGPEQDTDNQNADRTFKFKDKEHAYFPFPVEPGELVVTEELDFYKDPVVDGLTVPWGMTFLDEGKVLVSERRGKLHLVEEGLKRDEPVANVPEVFHENQAGLLDLKAHPDYDENGWIYMTYAYEGDEGNNTALARAKLEDNALTDKEVLMKAEPEIPGGRHLGSRIAFIDEHVYFNTADRGQMDPAQDSTNSSGSVIRLYHDGEVPEDNPFQDVEGAAPEVYTYGHRNPQGMDVHPETGEIWINEHGPKGGDEINIIRAGKNYGWPLMTYGIDYDESIITEDTLVDGMEPCIHHWTPSIAPSGMAIVNGDIYPEWEGNVMNGALANQHLNRVETDLEAEGLDMITHEERIMEGIGRIRDVNQGPDGYLYISVEQSASGREDGRIIRLLPAD